MEADGHARPAAPRRLRDLRGVLGIGRLPEGLPTSQALLDACAAGEVGWRRIRDLLLFSYPVRGLAGRRLSPVAAQARGLIIDLRPENHPVAAWPLPAFFDMEPGDSLSGGEPEVTRKMDGALVIQYWDGHTARWAGRSSFRSLPARLAQRLWVTRRDRHLESHLTLLCELLAPELGLPVSTARRELVLVGAVDRRTGRDLGHAELREVAAQARLPVVDIVPWPGSMEALWRRVLEEGVAGEGYVLRFPDGRRGRLVHPDYGPLYDLLSDPSPWMVSEIWMERADLGRLLQRLPSTAAAEVARAVDELDALSALARGRCEDPRRVAASLYRCSFARPHRASTRLLPVDV